MGNIHRCENKDLWSRIADRRSSGCCEIDNRCKLERKGKKPEPHEKDIFGVRALTAGQVSQACPFAEKEEQGSGRMTSFFEGKKEVGAKRTLLRRGGDGGIRTHVPISRQNDFELLTGEIPPVRSGSQECRPGSRKILC